MNDDKKELKIDFVETKSSFTGSYNAKLVYRKWETSKSKLDKVMIILHRGHEHSARVESVACNYGEEDYTYFAYDMYGHGESDGKKGFAKSFYHWVEDLHIFVKYLKENHNVKEENIVILANSVGAVVASTYIVDYAPKIRALALVAPAFSIKLYVPFAESGIRFAQKINPLANIKSYVTSQKLTRDVHEQNKYDNDTLITKNISGKVLIEMFDTAKRVILSAGSIYIPTILLSAGDDFVVFNRPQHNFYKNLSHIDKELKILPKSKHAILYDNDKQEALNSIKNFFENQYDKDIADLSFLKDAHKVSDSTILYNKLLSNPPLCKQIQFCIVDTTLKTLGRALSKGIRIGYEYGFDAGQMLDYVYENQPSGNCFTKMIDKIYLNGPGWTNIRKRKENFHKICSIYVKKLVEEQNELKVLDIASGPGRYWMELAENFKDTNKSFILRDFSIQEVEACREKAQEYDLSDVIKNEQADAFNPKSYEKLTFNDKEFKANLATSSGLFELFNDNELLLNAINGIYKSLDKNGLYIYTNMPYHSQIELMARVLPNRDGENWVSRLRSQAEMDELVRSAGFEKIDTISDSDGFFTVSVAIKK